jgi:hypothetical protein
MHDGQVVRFIVRLYIGVAIKDIDRGTAIDDMIGCQNIRMKFLFAAGTTLVIVVLAAVGCRRRRSSGSLAPASRLRLAAVRRGDVLDDREIAAVEQPDQPSASGRTALAGAIRLAVLAEAADVILVDLKMPDRAKVIRPEHLQAVTGALDSIFAAILLDGVPLACEFAGVAISDQSPRLCWPSLRRHSESGRDHGCGE